MIELKITGANAQEFGTNALQTLTLIVRGAVNQTTPVKPAVAEEQPKQEQAKDDTPVAEPLENPKASDPPPELQTKPKRGRPAAVKAKDAEKQVDIEDAIDAKKKADLPNDNLDDFTGKTAEPAKPKATVDQCRQAVVKLYENYVARAREAGEKDEDAIVKGKVAYARQLLYPFGVQKIPDLKPEQYDEFMAKAQGYIDGSTPLNAA